MKFAAHRVPGLVVVAAAILLGVTLGSPAATLTLLPDADTMLSEYFPENNFGAMPFANSGSTRMLTRNRALFRFDVAGHLPAGARIRSASLILEVVGQPAEPFASGRFNLHRLLKPWGEGTKTNAPGGGAGQGSPATTGEATWTHRFAFTTNTWTSPGAAATNDFVAEPSSGVTVFGVDQSPYTIPSADRLVADLQLWLDQPATNFGWILVCEHEGTPFTARRFGTREDPLNAPRLEIEYDLPVRIDSVQRAGTQTTLSFLVEPGWVYTVEFANGLPPGGWQSLAHISPASQPLRVSVTDFTPAPQRFYRLVRRMP